jgi:hypothetical protein
MGEALWRLPRVRYDEMVERGLLDSDDKVELLDGLLIAKEPQSSLHASAVLAAEAALAKAGWKYRNVRLLQRGATITPLAAPRRRIRVSDLLPAS